MEHPEHIFLVVDVLQHQADQKVVALIVTKLKVYVAVSQDHFTDLFAIRSFAFVCRFADQQIRSTYNCVVFYFIQETLVV